MVRLYLNLFVGVSFVRYLCLSSYCVLFFFVLYALCCQFIWIVNFWLPQYSLTFIYNSKVKKKQTKQTNKNKQTKNPKQIRTIYKANWLNTHYKTTGTIYLILNVKYILFMAKQFSWTSRANYDARLRTFSIVFFRNWA